jgi:hypothetical protein
MLAHRYDDVPRRPVPAAPRLRALPSTAAPPAPAGPARELADALRRARRVPPRLQDALVRACASPRPFRSVSRLAAAADCDRRTLWRDWKQAVGTGAPLRLEDVLHWVILARALALKTSARTWCEVADELCVHPHTLARFARLFTGLTLRRLSSAGPLAASAALRERILPHLSDGEAPHLALLRE